MVTEINIEDRQLQKQTQEKRSGDLTFSYTMNDITNHYKFERPKETRRSTSKTSPGGRASRQQNTFDCQQVTVCNTRSKVRIATWNVRTKHQPGN